MNHHPRAPPASTTPTGLSSLEDSLVGVIQRVAPEVVQISNSRGLGSGVVFDDTGEVVTNAHVVSGGGPLQVTDSRGHVYRAKLVGSLCLTTSRLSTPRERRFTAPPSPARGPRKLATSCSRSATPLVCEARSRTASSALSVEPWMSPRERCCPVPSDKRGDQSGRSGGALVGLDGTVVGIPTLAATDPQLGEGPAPGIGFAIPRFIVSDIAGQLIRYGHVVNSHLA